MCLFIIMLLCITDFIRIGLCCTNVSNTAIWCRGLNLYDISWASKLGFVSRTLFDRTSTMKLLRLFLLFWCEGESSYRSSFGLQIFRISLFGNILFLINIRRGDRNLLLTSRSSIGGISRRLLMKAFHIALAWPKFNLRIRFLLFLEGLLCNSGRFQYLILWLFQIDA